MLCNLYTRAGAPKHLDAEVATARRSSADSSPLASPARTRRSVRIYARRSARICWILVLSEFLFLSAFATANAQVSQSGNGIRGRSIASLNVKTRSRNAAAVKTARTRHRALAAVRRHESQKSSVQPLPTPPAIPPQPVPPADQPATPATISFQQGVLSIHAQNSSLVTILNQVSHQTGLVIEGLNRDKRVYGEYGPGNVTSTLTALLDGSGYNYVIIGGDSGHAPSKLILTQNNGAGASSPTAAIGNGTTATAGTVAEPVTADPSEPVRAKTPQEIFDELRKMHPQ